VTAAVDAAMAAVNERMRADTSHVEKTSAE
jgi:hypothetical protein